MKSTLSDGVIEVYPLDRFNWESVAGLKVREDQQAFLPENLFSIAQSRFEPGSEVLGIRYKGIPVGMLICLLQTSGVLWISRIMVEAGHQRLGIGKRALKLLLHYEEGRAGVREIRTSVAKTNSFALGFFESLGFLPLEGEVGGEVVLRFEKKG